ncbi:hypothetical protein DPMN_188236 [Dreissena polymorpha]|uniref:Uncharacterized protein n=1 Tax=Dreissena polymorpha TaxID=45954 RepID=A0A9D4I8A6_DREPO|nr:hypothetical protein DPMN_188236 [Dreissena polymorpha]
MTTDIADLNCHAKNHLIQDHHLYRYMECANHGRNRNVELRKFDLNIKESAIQEKLTSGDSLMLL